ncbi:MAG: protein TolQ [Alphaproteobacteria bacterium]
MNPTILSPAIPQAGGSLSILSLFWQAEPIIQLIALLLIAASFWCWTIIIHKTLKLRSLYSSAETFEESFWSGVSLDELYDRIHSRPLDPMSAVFCSAMREWRRAVTKSSLPKEGQGTLHQRIDRVMHVTQGREMERLEKHMGFLASTGATAPFVGVFGTVLGIIHTFQDIAHQQNTNLAVVAPGIAEALLVTAIGLVAAIPAMIAYNKLSGELARYANRLEAFANEFASIISRQLEEAV